MEQMQGRTEIDDAALRRVTKCCGKKRKSITKEEKEKYKASFEGEEGVLLLKNLLAI